MYLYQPCLLSLALLSWAMDGPGSKVHRRMVLFSLLSLSLSEVEAGGTYLSLYPAALLLPVPFLLSMNKEAWPEVLAAAFFGGMLCWKAADAWPLLPGVMLLCGMLLPMPACLLCRGEAETLLSICLGSLCFELFFCLREYVLFSFCVVRLGSREELSLGALSLLLYQLFAWIYPAVSHGRKDALSMEF